MRKHMEFMYSVAKGNVLEIGVCQGFSTSALLLGVRDNGGHLTSIDVDDCLRHVPRIDRPQEGWTFIQGDSNQMTWNDPIDVLFIDGGHDYPIVKRDMENFIPHVKPGGMVLMHDVEAPRFPGVRQAFNEWPANKEIRSGSYGLGIIYV